MKFHQIITCFFLKCLKVSLAKTEFLKLIVKYETSFRSSHRRCSTLFSKISKFSLEVPVLEFLVNKVAGLKACNFIERRLQHRCFPVHIAKFLRKPILKNICERLFLELVLRPLFIPKHYLEIHRLLALYIRLTTYEIMP